MEAEIDYDEDYDYDYDEDNNYDEEYMYEPEDQIIGDTHQGKYRIIPQSQLFAQIMKQAEQCSTYSSLPLGWSLLLLRQLKWDISFIPEYFSDISSYRKKIHYSEKYELPTSPALFSYQLGECLVCCGEGQQITNICGHTFCKQCWIGQIQAQFTAMKSNVTCLSCSVPVLHEILVKIFAMSDQKDKLNSRYEKLICEQFTTVNRSYQCCPGVDCVYCIKSDDFNTMGVSCNCGKLFCFKCKEDDHSPISCEEKSKWINLVMKEEADAKWIAVNAKICPWCSKVVERSAGCNYMACLCGKSFCYMCSKPWEPDHKDHFKCHIFKKSDADNIDKEKIVLEKMNFYGEKYTNENKVVSDLKKVNTFQKRRLLFQALNIDLTQSDFIEQAYKFAIECCEGLKWIYVYRYYCKFPSQNVQDVFQFTQGEYEKYKQELLKKLSYDFKKFLTGLQEDFEINGKKINREAYIQKFIVFKKNITNYYTSTKHFKEEFMKEIDKIQNNYVKKDHKDPIAPAASDLKKKSSRAAKKK